MKKIYVNKKAFTLIEILLALVLLSMIAAYIFKQIQHTKYLQSVSETQNQIREIIRDGIISPIGYASATGKRNVPISSDCYGASTFSSTDNGCSPNPDFTCLNTFRLVQCKEYNYSSSNPRFSLVGSNLAVGSNVTYPKWGRLVPQTDELMRNYGTCTFEVRQGSTRIEFEIFIDCSTVDFDERAPEFLEDAIKFVFQEDYADISVTIHDGAESMEDTSYTGDKEDGKIKAEFTL